jgi:hypothetical protein
MRKCGVGLGKNLTVCLRVYLFRKFWDLCSIQKRRVGLEKVS